MRSAMEFPRENGTSRDSQLAISGPIGADTVEEEEMVEWNQVGGGKCPVFPGTVFEMGDCSSQDVRVGNLHCDAIDYGDQLSLADDLQKNLKTGDDWGGGEPMRCHSLFRMHRMGIARLSQSSTRDETRRVHLYPDARTGI